MKKKTRGIAMWVYAAGFICGILSVILIGQNDHIASVVTDIVMNRTFF